MSCTLRLSHRLNIKDSRAWVVSGVETLCSVNVLRCGKKPCHSTWPIPHFPLRNLQALKLFASARQRTCSYRIVASEFLHGFVDPPKIDWEEGEKHINQVIFIYIPCQDCSHSTASAALVNSLCLKPRCGILSMGVPLSFIKECRLDTNAFSSIGTTLGLASSSHSVMESWISMTEGEACWRRKQMH